MVFIPNKWTRVYYSIIARAQTRVLADSEYTEVHHIIPKCMGGSNDSSNLVKLTLKEHYICHKLLVLMTTGKARGKLAYAVVLLANKMSMNGRIYESTKKIIVEYAKERNKGKRVYTNGLLDKMIWPGDPIPEGYYPGWSEAASAKRGQGNKGKRWITNGVESKQIKTDQLPEGWWFGQSFSHMALTKSNAKGKHVGWRWITDGKNNAIIRDPNQSIPEGWRYGQVQDADCIARAQAKLGSKNPMWGKTPNNAKVVVINGVTYKSQAEAQRAGYTRRFVENKIKEQTDDLCPCNRRPGGETL